MHGTTRSTRVALTGAIASTAVVAALGQGRQIRLRGVTASSGTSTSPTCRVRLTNGDGGASMWQHDLSATTPANDHDLTRRTSPNTGLFIVVDQVTGTLAGEVQVEWEPM